MNKKQLTLTLSAGLTLSLSANTMAGQEHVISAQPLAQGYQNVSQATETTNSNNSSSSASKEKASEGKCAEGKCAEGKCGHAK